MLIYQNNTKQFVEDVRQNVIADIMSSTFKERWSRQPGAAEFASWQNSLSRVRDLVEVAKLEGATQHQNQSTAFRRKDRRKIDGTENQRWVILSFHFLSDRFKGGKNRISATFRYFGPRNRRQLYN